MGQSACSARAPRPCSGCAWPSVARAPRAATDLGLGERQLERRCQALLGLTPKQMQRITRLHSLLSDALHRQRMPTTDAALAAGYYDQSHLARDARLLTGTTLRELLGQTHADGAWWPLDTQRLLARRQH